MLTLGIDSGTQSTKTIVLDSETGSIVASAQSGYGLIEGLPPGHLEQAPQTWIEAVGKTIADCLQKIGSRKNEIKAIGVSGQQHGLVVLDKQNEPIRPAKLWCDTSTAGQCEQFATEFGGTKGIIDLAGNAMLPGYTAPKLLWLKQNEPGNFKSIHSVLLPHDYINFWLTGEKRMEFGDASGTGLLDIRTRKWSEPLFNFIDPGLIEHFPQPESSRKAVGILRDTLRKEWGLPDNVVVSSGGGDNMMGAIGTGNIEPGVMTVSLGTSGTLYSFSDKPITDTDGEVAAFCDSTDAWLPLVCTMNVTVATELVRKMFRWNHAQEDDAVSSAPAGSGGLLFLPYLNGERTPNLPKGCGVYHGFNTENMQPGHLARATMEGATLGLAYGLNRFRELGVKPAEIRLTGGGSNSRVWRQLAADIFGVPTVCLTSSEGAALGAAIQAIWTCENVLGHTTPLKEITSRLVTLDNSTRAVPDEKNNAFYASLLHKHTDLTRRLHAIGYL
jgi:xylulokinase